MLKRIVEASGLELASWIAALRVQLPSPSSQMLSPMLESGVSRVESTVMPLERLESRAWVIGLVCLKRAKPERVKVKRRKMVRVRRGVLREDRSFRFSILDTLNLDIVFC